MLFMMEWKIKDGCVKKAVDKFLSTQAPVPEGCQIVGRYHAPGSGKGWLIVDTNDLKTVYEHSSEWSEMLKWDVTPIVSDSEAGQVSSKVWS